MFFLKKQFISVLVVFAFVLTGCVRYIESREELSQRFNLDPAAKRAGIQGFYRYEQEQRKRLEMLVREREKLAAQQQDTDYRIGPSDEIILTIKNLEDVNKEYTVAADGKIKLPFLGSVKIDGLTEKEAADRIAELATEYVVDPRVDVVVTKYSSNTVWVLDNSNRGRLNETTKQNAYPIKRKDYTLLDLLLELENTSYFDSGMIHFYPAVGSNSFSKEKKKKGESVIDRFNSLGVANWTADTENEKCTGEEYNSEDPLRVKACYPYENNISETDISAKYDDGARIDIDVEELFGGVTKKPLRIVLQPGDLIHIAAPPVIQIYGEVFAPGTFMAAQAAGFGMMGAGGGLIKPTLLSAITAARGLTYGADIGNVEIYREIQLGNKAIMGVDLEKVVFLGGQDVKLRDGDIVLVPSKHGRFYESTTINAINNFAGTVVNVDNTYNVVSN